MNFTAPLREVTAVEYPQGQHAGNVVLALDCGHRIIRLAKYPTPKRSRCPECREAKHGA